MADIPDAPGFVAFFSPPQPAVTTSAITSTPKELRMTSLVDSQYPRGCTVPVKWVTRPSSLRSGARVTFTVMGPRSPLT